MNYIRTENKIYEVESEFLDNEGKWVGYNIIEDDMALILRSQVINQADTIEELCDEFVIKHIQGEKPYLPDNFKKELIAVDKQDIFKYGVQNLYGAIWTDKGLIYVAKMNKKGEWELL